MTRHEFDWHEEPEGTFLKWAVIHFASEGRAKGGDELFNRMSEATNKFEDVSLRIEVSGVEVDAAAFMKNLDDQMDWATDRAAKRLVREGVPALEQLQEAVAGIDRAIKARIKEAAKEAGLEFEEDEWDRW